MDAPWEGDAVSLVDAFRRDERSPLEELEATLSAIEASELNAFSHLDPERARAAAADADVHAPFGGVLVGVKELDEVEGRPATEASVALADKVAEHQHQGAAHRRCRRRAGRTDHGQRVRLRQPDPDQAQRRDPEPEEHQKVRGRISRFVPMPCRILIVQHGEKERQPGDPGLTASGREQAELTGGWITKTHRLSRVVSSPMRRAVETAAPIARAAGVDATIDPRLRERMNWNNSAEMSLDEFLAEWHQASSDRSFEPRSGDSSERAAERFLATLRELAGDADDGDVVAVVAHGGVTVDSLRTVLGDETVRRELPDLIPNGVPCCAVTELLWDGAGWDVRWPSTAHLTDPAEHRPV
jgi:broad specificity phosphatase PhoE